MRTVLVKRSMKEMVKKSVAHQALCRILVCDNKSTLPIIEYRSCNNAVPASFSNHLYRKIPCVRTQVA